MGIVKYGAGVLREQTVPVKQGEDLGPLIDKMISTMHHAGGVGLAAPQMGVSKSLFVYRWEEEDHVVANPSLQHINSRENVQVEGCLSIPGFAFNVPRHDGVSMTFKDPTSWETRLLRPDEPYHSRILQHECDHLEGRLIFDSLNRSSRREFLKQWRSDHGLWA